MNLSTNKGQALMELLILSIFLALILLSFESCQDHLQRKYNAQKIQKRYFFKNSVKQRR